MVIQLVRMIGRSVSVRVATAAMPKPDPVLPSYLQLSVQTAQKSQLSRSLVQSIFLSYQMRHTIIDALLTIVCFHTGHPCLITALLDGSMHIRSCHTGTLLVSVDGAVNKYKAAWTITSFGINMFASAGDSGEIVLWKICEPMVG